MAVSLNATCQRLQFYTASNSGLSNFILSIILTCPVRLVDTIVTYVIFCFRTSFYRNTVKLLVEDFPFFLFSSVDVNELYLHIYIFYPLIIFCSSNTGTDFHLFRILNLKSISDFDTTN